MTTLRSAQRSRNAAPPSPAQVPSKAAAPRSRAAASSAQAAARVSAPAHTPTLSQQAYGLIRSKIIALELRPGQFLNEAALCELTGLGRMPVHQAIHRLQIEGLVEVIARKGLVIRMDSLNDVLALLEARLVMEPNIAALAAQRISKAQTQQLRAMLKESKTLMRQQQREAFSVLDRAFHGLLADAAGNRILVDTQRPLHERSDLIWRLRIMPEEGLEVTQREHEAVLRAIVAHDAQAAHHAMQAHLLSLQQRILKASQQ